MDNSISLGNKNTKSILFLGKTNNSYVNKALNFCRKHFSNVEIAIGEQGTILPENVENWRGDYIISFLSYWILPESIINNAKIAAINFHPASPDYPGIGCYNFALYEASEYYGATCHHMEKKVDSGNIISVKRFRIFSTDDVESLIEKTYDNLIVLFYEVLSEIFLEKDLPKSSEQWTKKATTRKDLNNLATITTDMDSVEVQKRVRATTYKNWKPTILQK